MTQLKNDNTAQDEPAKPSNYKVVEIDDENYYEPIDLTKDGMYKVKDYDEHTSKYRWKITNPRESKRLLSEVFMIAGHPWRILVFPLGNNVESISIYLDVADAKSQTGNWSRFARFQLSILNFKDVRKSIAQEAEKRFNFNENDWGFREFMPLAQLYNEDQGYYSNNCFIVECVVHLCTEPYIVNPANYDSKKETDFVGLKNQGATCYMNSLLQSWYHITYLRKAVYKMPIEENETPTSSIPLALQRVFYSLQNEKTAVDTKELTKSFGWDTIDSFLQHDVQELARVLSDNLEKKMDKTPAKGTMRMLFEGSIKNYIKCINVAFESSRVETFYDLQLNVKGCKTVEDSFKNYIEDELLQGDNQYRAEGFGMQDAKKGCIFMKFPPVLTLHLKRFEYDVQKDSMHKINDRYQFPTQLDLSKYLAPESEFYAKDNSYTLFSVLVHSGDVTGGHYYAFVRPHPNTPQWYKFDDEKVYKVKDRDAIDDNFGGEDKKSKFFWRQPSNNLYKKFTNAYMLVYIKTSEIANILKLVEDEDVPDHLRIRVERERAELERKKREKAEAPNFVNIRITTNEHLRKHIGPELIRQDSIEAIKLKKSNTIVDLKKMIQEKLGIPLFKQRLWRWESRQNKTYRPDNPIKDAQELQAIEKLFPNLSTTTTDTLNLYLEECNIEQNHIDTLDHTIDNPHPLVPIERDDVLLFVKFYDPATKNLSLVGNLLAKHKEHIADIIPRLNTLLGLDKDVALLIYEEIKPTMIEPVDYKSTVKQAELQHGDILVCQKPLTQQEMSTLEYPKVPDYYKYLQQRITIKFAKLSEPKQVVFSEELLRTMTYQQVTEKIAPKLQAKPDLIRLTGHNPYGEGVPRAQPFKTSEVKSLKDMLHVGQSSVDILYYEILDIPLVEIETKKELCISWFNSKVEEVKKIKLLVAKDASVQDVLEEVKTKVQPEDSAAPVRLLEVFNHRIHKIFPMDERVDSYGFSTTVDLRAEEVPADQRNVEKPDRIIQVQHFCKENHSIRAFGSPFYLKVSENETLEEVKKRIQQQLDIKDDEFKKYKFAPLSGTQRHEYLNDADAVATALEKVDAYRVQAVLGIEHKDKTPRAASWYDKPIIIKN